MQVGLPFSFADIAAARARIASAVVRTHDRMGPTTRLRSAAVDVQVEVQADVQVETADRWHRDAVVSALESSGSLVTTVD